MWDQAPVATVSLEIAHAASPSGLWTVGNKYAAILEGAQQKDILNDGSWGTAVDRELNITSASALFRIESNQTEGLRTIVVEEFSATIASFVHSATDPDATGANTYNLNPNKVSSGTLKTSSGEIVLLYVYAKLTNSYFAPSAPALVLLELVGDLDPDGGSGTLEIAGGVYEE